MKSSSAALACAALACAGTPNAGAQEVSVQLYGTFNIDLESVKAGGASPAAALAPGQLGTLPSGINVGSRNRVTQNSSNFGIRGSENLGGGWNIFFQVESAAALDAGGTTIASRNSAVGLQSNLGSIRIGQWDTPYKTLSGAVDPMYFTGITYTGALIGTPGFGVGPVTNGGLSTSADGRTYANAANASFERRQGNVVQYWSPSINGFAWRLAYAANENKTSEATNITHVNPDVLSASVQYEIGPLFLGYAYEQHRDLFGLSALVPAAQAAPIAAMAGLPAVSARDRGDKLVARYSVADSVLGVMWEKLKYAQSIGNAGAGAIDGYQRSAVSVTIQQKIGRGTLRGLYTRAQDGSCDQIGGACDAAGLGAKQFSLGYSYTFSKRTDLYWFYTRIDNAARGSYQFANSAGIGAAAGAASIGYVSGIRHTF